MAGRPMNAPTNSAARPGNREGEQVLLEALLRRPVLLLLVLLPRLPLCFLLPRGARVVDALNLVLIPFGTVDKGADPVVNQHWEYNCDTESQSNLLGDHMVCCRNLTSSRPEKSVIKGR